MRHLERSQRPRSLGSLLLRCEQLRRRETEMGNRRAL
ncbi:hypothetical protein ACHAWF_003175 [Thalassiosira exigua]